MPRRLDAADLDEHLDWLRAAVADPHLNTRLVLAGILDVLDGTIRSIPAPRREPEVR